jgi:integrase/recombinase XerD
MMTDMAQVTRLPAQTRSMTLAGAAEAFLAQGDLTRPSRRVYGGSMAALIDGLGANLVLADINEEQVRQWFRKRYGALAPATWNRELATLRSALRWWARQGWLTADPAMGLDRRRERPDRTRALTRSQVEGLWRRKDVSLREKALWRLLYETAARANEVLGLDIEDLDLPSKRGRVRSKGGAIDWVFWQTGAAQLLPRLVRDRRSGPLFLAERRPTRAVATLDLDPTTSRARLSYRRAADLFASSTGWTLHQLRHSALTHAAEDGTNLPTLLARSRHASVRSLERYARPGPEAVARAVAEADPARRRRR